MTQLGESSLELQLEALSKSDLLFEHDLEQSLKKTKRMMVISFLTGAFTTGGLILLFSWIFGAI